MEIKAVHFDMKSMIPTADYALTLVDELAEQGFNAILVEFEDKFPFDATAGLHHPCAWTKEEFRRFGAHCKEKNVELIPLLQSIGHLDYILKYPKFRDLRDGGPGGTSYQWCLALEETYELWCAMAEELLEVFPGTKIFHIGADECNMRIPCERCGSDKLDLYIKRVSRCAEYIQKKNLKVVLWDDVFRNHGAEKFAELPKGVIPCVWMYRELDYDYLERMAASGLEFWSASCIQAHRFYSAMAPQEPKMRNVDAWGAVHAKYPRISGHVGTAWGRIQCQSPIDVTLPQSMFMSAYLSETLTKGVITDRKKFANEFGKKFFGMELDYDAMFSYFCYEPACAGKFVTELKDNASRHRDLAEIWYGFNEIDKMLEYIYTCFANNEAMLTTWRAGMAPNEMTSNWLDGVRRCYEDTLAGLERIKPMMLKYFPEKMWDEFVDQRFTAKLEQNEYWRHVLTNAAAKWKEYMRK